MCSCLSFKKCCSASALYSCSVFATERLKNSEDHHHFFFIKVKRFFGEVGFVRRAAVVVELCFAGQAGLTSTVQCQCSSANTNTRLMLARQNSTKEGKVGSIAN